LLDYGQVKDLPEQLRLGYANLVLAIANRDPLRAAESYRYWNLSYPYNIMLSFLLKIRTEVYNNADLQAALPVLLGIDNEINGLIGVEYKYV